MKTVSYQDLKRNLSSVLNEVAAGTEVLITRHNKPTALLRSPQPSTVHIGGRFGRATLKPLLSNATAGRYLEFLRQDRQEGQRDGQPDDHSASGRKHRLNDRNDR